MCDERKGRDFESGMDVGRGRCGEGRSSPWWWVRSPPMKRNVSVPVEKVVSDDDEEEEDVVVRARPAR